MLVITDEAALGICRERRFACAAEAEEQRRRAGLLSAVAEQCIESTPRFGAK